jgi:hypothetical protein
MKKLASYITMIIDSFLKVLNPLFVQLASNTFSKKDVLSLVGLYFVYRYCFVIFAFYLAVSRPSQCCIWFGVLSRVDFLSVEDMNIWLASQIALEPLLVFISAYLGLFWKCVYIRIIIMVVWNIIY